MRQIRAVLPLVILAACTAEAPPQPAGVGFGDYDEYLAQQQAQGAAQNQTIQPGLVVSPESTASGTLGTPTETSEPETVVAEGLVGEEEPVVDTLALEDAEDPDNPNISDEQNFDAVSARESIESDRERLERQRQQFQVVQPTRLPKRRGDAPPNIVAYALSTTNPVGQPRYQRGPLKSASATQRNCARYLTADLAQEAFLAAGGPEKDPKRLDPDGDGFACGWDPSPYRVVRN